VKAIAGHSGSILEGCSLSQIHIPVQILPGIFNGYLLTWPTVATSRPSSPKESYTTR
jgi:hypothetical protein